MMLHHWLSLLPGRLASCRQLHQLHRPDRRRRSLLGGPTSAHVEVLEDRTLLSGIAIDAFEPNNSVSDATNLGAINGLFEENDLTIHSDTDRDFFRFEMQAAGTAAHRVEILFAHAQGDLDMRLLDANGAELVLADSPDDDEEISLAGRAAGVYFIEVFGFQGATNSYDLVIVAPQVELAADRFELNDTLATATDLGPVGGTLSHEGLTIHDGADVDFFRFELQAAGTAAHAVEIRFLDALGDLDMRLLDANGAELVLADSPDDDERISLAGRAAGVYFIEVFGFDGDTNSYDLEITAPEVDRFEPNDTRQTATNLGIVNGTLRLDGLTIHSGTDVDFFRFELQEAGAAIRHVEIKFTHAQGNLDLRLLDANGATLFSSTSTTDDERITLDGLPAGVYFIEVFASGGNDANSNSYDLMIVAPEVDRFEPNDTLATATDLRGVNGPLRLDGLTIHNRTDRDFFRFELLDTGGIDHHVEIQFRHTDGDLDLRLRDANGLQLASAESATNNERISLHGRAAGVYFVEVFGFQGAINSYDLVIAAPAVPIIVVGPNPAPNTPGIVRVLGPNGQERFNFEAFDASFGGAVRVAVGDVTGDGVPDIIAAASGNLPGFVRVFSSVDGTLILEFRAFGPNHTGPVFLAVGDVTGNGRDEIIVGRRNPGRAVIHSVTVGEDGIAFSTRLQLVVPGSDRPDLDPFGLDFDGAVVVAAGDVTGNGRADLIVGQRQFGSQVRVFSLDGPDGLTVTQGLTFEPFEPGFQGGVLLAAGDVNGDGSVSIVVSRGTGAGTVRVFSATGQPGLQFEPFSSGTFGSFPAVADVNGNGRGEILVSAGLGEPPVVQTHDGISGELLSSVTVGDDPDFEGGFFVAAAAPPSRGLDDAFAGDELFENLMFPGAQ